MSKVEEIIAIVEKESPGLLDGISLEDGIIKESLVRKVLALSHGQMERTHQNQIEPHVNTTEGLSTPPGGCRIRR